MNKIIKWLNTSFAPKLMKMNSNIWIQTIKESVLQTIPFIFLGSLFCCLAILNNYFPSLPSFWTPFGWTMGMVSLFISFLIPFNYMEKKRIRKQRILAALCGVILFLIVISPKVIEDGIPGFGHSAMGAGGMFIAIVTGVFVSFVMELFSKISFFKEDSVIPDFVRVWFDSMLPIAVIVVTGWVVVDILQFDMYNLIVMIFMPLSSILQSPFGLIAFCFFECFIYSMGISTWVLTPIVTPVMLAAIAANVDGTGAYMVTDTAIFSTYLWIGGIGSTLSLSVMMAFSKSKKLKALGKACVIPGIFNINEPIVFGAIAWNPILMIPMWIQGIVLPAIMWTFTKIIPFAPVPMVQFEMWYTPFPISTWIVTRSVSAVILLVVIGAVGAMIWYPFFKAYEQQELENELEHEQKQRIQQSVAS